MVRLVFCGTPEFAVPCLRAVVDARHEVALVITQPDRPAGRKMELQQPAVKQFAVGQKLPVEQPEKIRTNEALRKRLEEIAPDAIVVVAYGRIIPSWMLALPRCGCINVHGSLLPKYRGAAPIQWAIANGERETGVTTMVLNEGLDTGDMLLETRVAMGPDATAEQMYPLLADAGAAVLLRTLDGLAAGLLVACKQNDAEATLAPILTREDGRLDLTRTAQQTYDRWRGFTPWPGCWGEFRGKRFLLAKLRMSEAQLAESVVPGRLVLHEGALLMSAAQDTWLQLDEVQTEGKPRMTGAEFWRGFQVKAGECVR